MSAPADYVDVTCYAQVEPVWAYDNGTLPRRMRGAKVVRLTQSPPSQPIGGTVLIRLPLRIPVAAFQPLLPERFVVPEGQALPVLLGDPA